MATYNGEAYILQQFESLAAQTRLPDELVVSDDNSTDGTVDVIKSFAQSAPFKVRIIQNSHQAGYAGNFNRALLETRGRLVFLCDQDDSWFPNKIETIAELSDRHPGAMVIMNDVAMAYGDLSPAGVTKLEQYRGTGQPISTYVMGAATALRREFLDAVLPIPSEYPSHDDWLVKFAIGMKRRHLLDSPLQLYRIHGSNTSKIMVNTTKRLSGFDVLKKRLSQIRSGIPNDLEDGYLPRLDLEIMGARRAEALSHGELSAEFGQLASRLEETRNIALQRQKVQRLPRLQRIPSVAAFWRSGKYELFRKNRSAVIDLLVPPTRSGDGTR